VKRKSPVTAGGARDGVAGRGHTHGARPAGGPRRPPRPALTCPSSYFGPRASEVDRKLVGPVHPLHSGKLDRKRGTIRLPLYLGHMRDRRNVWYILTDTTDRDNAEALGLNHSAKLVYSQAGPTVTR